MSIAATASASQATASGSTATPAAASGSIAGNFNTFLTLLTTQMKNQDPTAPLDANQFTSQLVQFASVEQQINANTNLQTLIGLASSTALSQAASMVGHTVAVESASMPVQNGTGRLQFSLAAAQPLDISVANAAGAEVYRGTLAGVQGANAWTWDGKGSNGTRQPDGAYSVKLSASDGAKTEVPFTVIGTVTGASASGATPSLSIGPLSVPMSAVRNVVQ